jgi:hypothetical protein
MIKRLATKLETLLDRLIEIAEDERARRKAWPVFPKVDLFGPRGTEIRIGDQPPSGWEEWRT